MTTQLQKRQVLNFGPVYLPNGERITAEVRFDDEYGNGYNTFAITGMIKKGGRIESCGCLHDEVAKYFPKLAPFIKWHLCSTDGPLHYIANTVYHVQQGNLDYARNSAIWLDATDEELKAENLPRLLMDRLPELMEQFQAAVESLGLMY